MTTKMRRQTTYKLLTAALCSALLIAGCQKDDTKVSVPQPANGVLSFGISQDSGWSSPATKGETPAPVTKGESFRSEMLLMECDDPDSPLGEVYIYMVEEDIPEQQAAENLPATRGEEVPAEGNATVVDGAYGVFAYQGSGNVPETYAPGEGVVPFQDIQNLSLNSLGKYVGQDDGKEIYAPGAGTWLYFFAYGPHMTITESGKTANPALRENSQYPYLEYTATTDLAKTTDLIFGGTPKPISGEVNETVGLNVSHILSKIRIHTGTIAAGRITSISLKGIKNAGTYNLDNKGRWTLSTTTETYFKNATEGNVSFDDLYLMPQTLSDNAVLEIKVLIETPELNRSTTYTLTKKLSAFLSEWQANKQYTYTISTPREVEVHVSDEIVMDGTYPVKQNLVIKNCGLADAYIRVALAGAWVVDEGTGDNAVQYTVSDWKNTGDPTKDDGIFNWGVGVSKPEENSTNTRNWRLGDDGYYYYMKPVVPGEVLEPLFDSYKLTASSPVGGSYLAFTIIAQGVYLSDAQYIFPSWVTTTLANL